MTEWNKIYTNIQLSGSDGFTFITLPYVTWPEGDGKAFILPFIPEEKHDDDFAIKRAVVNPLPILRMYLCKIMSSTFCIGAGSRDRQAVYYIGARNPQDIFKLILKISGAKKTYTWPTEIKFSIRVAENDDYDPEKFKKGTLPGGIV